MSLDPDTYGQQAEQALTDQIKRSNRLSPEEMSQEFAAIYHDYGREGECGGVDISAGGDPSILEPAFISDNSPETITQIANALCDYWETFTEPGDAEVLDVVTNVAPDASGQRSEMENAIADYVASGDSRDGWVGWYYATQDVVSQIPFSVTEQDTSDGSTQTFTRFVT